MLKELKECDNIYCLLRFSHLKNIIKVFFFKLRKGSNVVFVDVSLVIVLSQCPVEVTINQLFVEFTICTCLSAFLKAYCVDAEKSLITCLLSMTLNLREHNKKVGLITTGR